MPDFELKNENVIYDGRKILVKKDEIVLPSGREVTREIVHHLGAAAILPLLDDDTALMIRQFRYSVRDHLWEIPAGTLEPPEPPEECAARELVEETGYRAGEMEEIARYFPSPGICDEQIVIYLARELERVSTDFDTNEISAVAPMSFRELEGKYKSGKLPDGKTQFALKIAGII